MKSTPKPVTTTPHAGNGKIARLPHQIRDQLSHRLHDGHQAKPVIEWLNALPEVRAVLASDFDGRAITKQNLSEWRKGGFQDWLVRQDALEFVQSLENEHDLGDKSLAGPFTDKLARWIALQYAAAARSSRQTRNSDARWARLRDFCADIARLRRGDLHAERLRLDQEWLALEQSNARHLLEEKFWAWTKKADINEKLYPKSRGLTEETLREIADALCLFDATGPGPDIAKLIIERLNRTRSTGVDAGNPQSHQTDPAASKPESGGQDTTADPPSGPVPPDPPSDQSNPVQVSPT